MSTALTVGTKRKRTRRRLATTGTAAAAVLGMVLTLLGLGQAAASPATAPAEPSVQATGFHISDGRLVEGNGNDFVLRGINHAHTWYPDETGSIADIKATGANSVRVVLSNGDRWTRNDASDVASVISDCKANRLICVLEVHDTTGYGEDAAATTLDRAAQYWIDIRSALQGQENYVIVDIGNEPYGNTGAEAWTADTKAAIQKLRDAGLEHTLMVDAPNWGQDWQYIMRDNAASVFASDPDRNTLFGIHMYGVFDNEAAVSDYLGHFVDAGLPIAVGEFGDQHSDGDPAEDAIMRITTELGLGYMGWSWSGNGGGVEYLDMVNDFNAGSLTSWGQRFINGADGIAQTSEEATVFGGGGDDGEDPGGEDPGTGACGVDYRIVNEWGGGFQGEVVITNNGSSAIQDWTLTWDFANGQQISQMWGGTASQSGSTVTVTPASYTSSIPAGGSVTVGFNASLDSSNSSPAGFALDGAGCATA